MTQTLSWVDGGGATSFNVFVNGVFNSNVVSPTLVLGGLSWMTAYTWRIDSVNACGTTIGDTWSFMTGYPVGTPYDAVFIITNGGVSTITGFGINVGYDGTQFVYPGWAGPANLAPGQSGTFTIPNHYAGNAWVQIQGLVGGVPYAGIGTHGGDFTISTTSALGATYGTFSVLPGGAPP